jgi:dihydrofolate reductase
MRKLRIIEHISLDGVIQHSADDGDFPHGAWTVPYRSPVGGDEIIAAYSGSYALLLGRRTYDIWSGFWPMAPRSPLAMASTRQQNISLPTVQTVSNGARSRPLDRTLSRTFAASSLRTARTLSSRVAPR